MRKADFKCLSNACLIVLAILKEKYENNTIFPSVPTHRCDTSVTFELRPFVLELPPVGRSILGLMLGY